jgi:hypothetical protein
MLVGIASCDQGRPPACCTLLVRNFDPSEFGDCNVDTSSTPIFTYGLYCISLKRATKERQKAIITKSELNTANFDIMFELH